LIIPETYILLFIFTAFYLWTIMMRGILKRIMPVIFALGAVILVSTASVSFIELAPRSVNVTSVVYDISGKIVELDHSYLPSTITRETLGQHPSLTTSLLTFYLGLFFIALVLILDDALNGKISDKLGRREDTDE